VGVKNQKFIKVPQHTDYISEQGSLRFEDGRIIVKDYDGGEKTVAWTTDTLATSGSTGSATSSLEHTQIFKVTAAQISAGEINLAYNVASAANVKIQQLGSINLVNASADETFFSSGNFSSDKPDFRAADASDIITIRATDLSTNIAENDLIEIRYDIDSDTNDKLRDVINQTPQVEVITVTNAHVNQGYFNLSGTPFDASAVEIFQVGGIEQLNRNAFSVVELNLLSDLPDYAVASSTSYNTRAIYIRGMDFSSQNDSDLQNLISGKINSGDQLIIYYRN